MLTYSLLVESECHSISAGWEQWGTFVVVCLLFLCGRLRRWVSFCVVYPWNTAQYIEKVSFSIFCVKMVDLQLWWYLIIFFYQISIQEWLCWLVQTEISSPIQLSASCGPQRMNPTFKDCFFFFFLLLHSSSVKLRSIFYGVAWDKGSVSTPAWSGWYS